MEYPLLSSAVCMNDVRMDISSEEVNNEWQIYSEKEITGKFFDLQYKFLDEKTA